MFVRNQLGERIINLKYMKEIRVFVTHPTRVCYIEAVDEQDYTVTLGVYSSLETAQKDMDGLNEAMEKPENENFVYPLHMDDKVDPLEDPVWKLRFGRFKKN